MTYLFPLWLIPLLPFAGFLINGIVGRRLPKVLVTTVALLAPLGSFIAVVGNAFGMFGSMPTPNALPVIQDYGPWINAGPVHVDFSLSLDQLSLVMLLVVTGVLVVLGIAFAWPLVRAFAGDYANVPGKLELTVLLTRIMLPFLTLVSVAAVMMGMLNSLQHFFIPALAPAMFNLATILCALLAATFATPAIADAFIANGGALVPIEASVPGVFQAVRLVATNSPLDGVRTK